MSHRQGTALLVVDVQKGAVALGPYECAAVLENIARLIDACRGAGVEVVYVQHDGLPGEDLEPGSPGWEIHAPIGPRPSERVFRKQYNSAFRGTDLGAYLEARGVGTLILVGIQTEYCIDTTCRVAFELGFEVVMPELTNSTFNNGDVTARQVYEMYNERIFAGRFASVPSMSGALEAISGGGRFS